MIYCCHDGIYMVSSLDFSIFFFTYNNKLKSGLCVEPSFQCAIKAKKKATNAKTFAQIYDAAYAMP